MNLYLKIFQTSCRNVFKFIPQIYYLPISSTDWLEWLLCCGSTLLVLNQPICIDFTLRFSTVKTVFGRNERFDTASCSILPHSTRVIMDNNQLRIFRARLCHFLLTGSENEQSAGARALAVIHVIISARPIPLRPLCLAPIIHDTATRQNFHCHSQWELEYNKEINNK